MVAPTEATVLITGSGTGRKWRRGPSTWPVRGGSCRWAIHCGALTEPYSKRAVRPRKGAFTGRSFAKGKFRNRRRRRVFPGQISDISLKTQTDLLRVLQEKEIVRVGGNRVIKWFPLHRAAKLTRKRWSKAGPPATCITGCMCSASSYRPCATAARIFRWSTTLNKFCMTTNRPSFPRRRWKC